MIIDLILNRYDSDPYNAKSFYSDILEYESLFDMSHDISIALDYGKNEDVQNAICEYIDRNGYNPNIKCFVNAVNWIENDSGMDYSSMYPLNETVSESESESISESESESDSEDFKERVNAVVNELYPPEFIEEIQNKLNAAIDDIFKEYQVSRKN